LFLSIVKEEEIGGVEFIIVASDGLWNVLSNKVRLFCS
jgi:protein phosphatase 1L